MSNTVHEEPIHEPAKLLNWALYSLVETLAQEEKDAPSVVDLESLEDVDLESLEKIVDESNLEFVVDIIEKRRQGGAAAKEAFRVLKKILGEKGLLNHLLRFRKRYARFYLGALYSFAHFAAPSRESLRSFSEIFRLALEAGDGDLRAKVVARIGEFPFTQILPFLLFSARDRDEIVANTAIHWIERTYPGVCLDVLQSFRADDIQVRLSALEELVTIQPELRELKDSLVLFTEATEFPGIAPNRVKNGKEASMAAANLVSGTLAEKTENFPKASGGSVSETEKWLPRFWANEDKVSLRFATTDELDATIDWLWTVPDLRDLPRVHVGENTMVVPAQAADLFRKKGFQFILAKVTSAGDFTPEEANRIRKTG